MGLTGLRGKNRKAELSKSSKRKVEKKLNFIAKITEAVTSLGAKKKIHKKRRLRSHQKKVRAYDLSVLSESLPNEALTKSSKPTDFKVSCKNRQKLVQKESELLRYVHKHPTFQTDPISAIQKHLEQTQPPPPAEEKIRGRNKRDRRKSSNKSSASLQNMQM